jgi:hypothetical protein
MSYVVPSKDGAWEIRQSAATPRGPRSRTLARFRVLTDDVVQRALERAGSATNETELRRAAARAGAPVAAPGAGAAAAQLVEDLSRGRRLPERLRRLAIDALGGDAGVSDEERAVGEWIAATPAKRGETLVDLLDLADKLPHRREGALRFPPLSSSAR